MKDEITLSKMRRKCNVDVVSAPLSSSFWIVELRKIILYITNSTLEN